MVLCKQHCIACSQILSETANRNVEFTATLANVQNLCFAAQQCGVAKCAGTMVNMRKPLCNLGQVIANELLLTRVMMMSMWNVVADAISGAVELTVQRREVFELRWPDEAVQQFTCSMKDTIVSLAASITSLLGAISHLLQDVSLHSSFIGTAVDSRVHARYIMLLSSLTNLISSLLMLPVYTILVMQKLVSCTLNDMTSVVTQMLNSNSQPQMRIFFGSQAVQQAVADSEIAVCLSEDIRESLQEVSMLVSDTPDTSATGGNTVHRVLNTISSIIADTVDVSMRAFVQYAYHHIDILLAYIIGVLKGMMDVAQTADWEDCKLPVVETGIQGLGRCACGDKAYRISPPVKQQAWNDGAFWCSGLLMLNEGDGSDLIVWNPH